MAELKTKETTASVADFLDAIPDEARRDDCRAIAKMMQRATKSKPKMWGDSIVGFGSTRLRYTSGRECDWFPIGFSPRKANLTLYLLGALMGPQPLLKKLGKHTHGKGCLYIKRLADVDVKVLDALIQESVEKLEAYRKKMGAISLSPVR